MIIFIDESGDSGFKIEKGSSAYLIISLIVFYTEKDRQNTVEKISMYKKRIKYPSSYEFKFSKTKKSIIVGFLKSTSRCQYSIKSIIVDKKELGISKRVPRIKIYNYLLVLLLGRILDKNERTEIRLDGVAEKEFRKAVQAYLRKNLKEMKINLKMVNSKSDVLIQLADIIVGSIRRSYLKEKGDKNLYKDIIKDKIVEEWIIKRSDLEPILK